MAVVYRNIKNYFGIFNNIGFTCWFNINNWTMNDNYHLFNYYDGINSQGIDITITGGNVNVLLNSDMYQLPLVDDLQESTWYAYILNVDQRTRKVSQWLYKRNVDDEARCLVI
jgi:hypothetical protein